MWWTPPLVTTTSVLLKEVDEWLKRRSTLITLVNTTSNAWSPVLNMSIKFYTIMAIKHSSVPPLEIKLKQKKWVSTNNSWFFCVSPSCSLTNLISNIFVHHLCFSGETDITGQSSINGHICYQSNWSISSLKLPPNITSVNKSSSDSNTLCVQTNDICSDYKITFTSETCVNTSFDITKNIIVGLYKKSYLYIKIHMLIIGR